MPKAGKVSKAPDGFYTAGEAIKRLGMPKTTFHHYVRIGKIKKKTPYGRSEGYYEKTYIDKMAEASQLYAIQYADDPATFSVATSEDAQGVYDVMVSLWGTLNVTPVQTRLEWYKINPEIDYVVKQDNIVVGYLTIKPYKHEVMQKLISGEILAKEVKPDDLLPFTPGVPLECLVATAVRAGVYEPKKYGMRLVAGAIEVFKGFAQRGVVIAKLYANSETPDGIRLCKGLGFEDISTEPNKTPRRFMLDLKTSKTPFAAEYKQILKSSGLLLKW
ncbi:MAG: hypothetical protein H0W02_19270 [Ktedonobacteraceae bacterium]|nr:hypothetical protein [Ktedonobacteraceae bacterium]